MDHPSKHLANSGRRPSSKHNDTALRPNDADLTHRHHHDISHHYHSSSSRTSSHLTSPPQTDDDEVESSTSGLDLQELKEQNCDRRRPEEDDHSRLDRMSADLVGKTVTPFLREHVPGLYAPVSKIDSVEKDQTKTPSVNTNSRYCYRHRPDSKCRKAADESKMAKIQSELDKLPPADQQAITTIWSLFSAAPSKHRELMLQGVITQLCFPQLSLISREVHDQLKIDFLTALPTEISYKILCYLDSTSLCSAAQVSRRWRQLADDDVVWHRLCEQHIDRKCTKCGWGLPLLERKRLRDWTRQKQAQNQRQEEAAAAAAAAAEEEEHHIPTSKPLLPPAPNTPRSPASPKRDASYFDSDGPAKRQCVTRVGSSQQTSSQEQRKFRPWKDVYRDRFKVGSNWKYGRFNFKSFRGHTNGVTCLQLSADDNILATGSYDATIKIWDVETGEVLRELKGHTRGIRTLQFDDSKLISGSLDKTIKIWNWHTGACLATIQGHTEGVISVNFDGDVVASGSIDSTVKVFNYKTKQSFCLRGHSDWVNQVRLDMASRTCLSASDDCRVILWDLDTKRPIHIFEGHVGHVQQVLPLPPDFEPDDDPTVVGAGDTDAVSVASGRSSTPALCYSSSNSSASFLQADSALNGHAHATTAASPDSDIRAHYGPGFTNDPSRPLPSRYILTGGLDSTIRCWDTATGKCLRTFFGHLEGIWGLVGDTLRVVSGANDGMVKVWEPRSGKCEKSFTGHLGPVTCVALSDSRMASGGEDGEVRLYSFQDVVGEGTPGVA